MGSRESVAFSKCLQMAEKKQKDMTIKEAVNAAPREWRKKLIENYKTYKGREMCPVLTAVSKSLETDGPADWIPAFEKAAGIKADQTINPLEISHQTYREILFLRAVMECQTA